MKMKTIMFAVPLVFFAGQAFAGNIAPITETITETNPTLFLGLSWTLNNGASIAGGGAGVTLKVLSTNKRNAGALSAGVTYNFDSTIGCDAGVAYNGNASETLTFGYDFCKRAPQFSVGGSGLPKTTVTTVGPT